jgi:hypothetical protein
LTTKTDSENRSIDRSIQDLCRSNNVCSVLCQCCLSVVASSTVNHLCTAVTYSSGCSSYFSISLNYRMGNEHSKLYLFREHILFLYVVLCIHVCDVTLSEHIHTGKAEKFALPEVAGSIPIAVKQTFQLCYLLYITFRKCLINSDT